MKIIAEVDKIKKLQQSVQAIFGTMGLVPLRVLRLEEEHPGINGLTAGVPECRNKKQVRSQFPQCRI